MKVSLNWLNDYVNLDGISVKELEEKMTMAGLEVEGIDDQRAKYDKFIVGYVKETKPHENADKLAVCTVSTGEEDLQIVCGAPNVAAGQKVPVALVGAVLPEADMKITKAKIRGVKSFGMICAEDELGLGNDHSGIMVLDENLEEGTPLSDAMQLNDVVFELGITPNRPDALSHFGVARDIAALFNREFRKPVINLNTTDEKAEDAAKITIEDAEKCPRYSGKVLRGAKIQESPEWLKKRLKAVGSRPINNVVDVTNYVLMETGQPLHAFDLKSVADQHIIVKCANEGDKFVTLDSQERKLGADMLMICDGEKQVAVAGVMGGENSEVTDDTTDILIESAHFNANSIRKTRNQLGMNTEASYRFERGTDPEMTVYAAERAAQLIVETGGGAVLNGTLDAYPKKIEKMPVTVRFARVKKILGYDVAPEKIEEILKALGFEIQAKTEEQLDLLIPTNRPDTEREIDVIEEIARINGYENIPTLERIQMPLEVLVDESAFAAKVRNVLSSIGFYEMYCQSLVRDDWAELTGKPVKILNPQSQDLSALRTSLLPGALETVRKNINVGQTDLKLYEIGRVFNANKEEITSFDDFTEQTNLLILMTGNASDKQWYTDARPLDFYDLSGSIKEFLENISLDNFINDSYYGEGNNVFEYLLVLKHKKQVVGEGGKLNRAVLKKFDTGQDVFALELRLDELEKIEVPEKVFNELLRYPKVYRDFAFIFDKSVNYKDVNNFIRKKASPLLKEVELFDIFESDSIGADKKSLAISLEYFDQKRTLREDEVDDDFKYLIDQITKEFNAVLRGS